MEQPTVDVGHHLLVARSDALARADTFELVAASAEHYQALGYEFMAAEATNQWTGAAFEALGGCVCTSIRSRPGASFARAPDRWRVGRVPEVLARGRSTA